MFSLSVLGTSTNDLDSQKCQYYQQSQINIRKLSTTINNNNNAMQNSTLSNTSSSSSSSINSSGKYGNMPHSQSTNDISAIFGRAWHAATANSNNNTMRVERKNNGKGREQKGQRTLLRISNHVI